MVEGTLQYVIQDSPQTLREAIAEYYARNPGLLDPDDMPDDAGRLFREHDAGHVVFGCDTSLRGETLIDTWTVLGSSAGLRGYVEYFKYPQVNQVFAQVGYVRIVLEFVRSFGDVGRVIARSRRLSSKWPWHDYRRYLDVSLQDLRSQFNIRVV